MADTIITQTTTTATPAPTDAQVLTTIKPLGADALKAEQDIAAILAAYKAGGVAAVTALAPNLIADVKQDITDVEAAIPVIKAGYKTSEFWIVVGVIVGDIVYTLITKKELPITEETIIATLAAVYASIRAISKSKATTT